MNVPSVILAAVKGSGTAASPYITPERAPAQRIESGRSNRAPAAAIHPVCTLRTVSPRTGRPSGTIAKKMLRQAMYSVRMPPVNGPDGRPA
ncbi:MAG: hypothetical protein QMD46_08840 [Methanomicrobiales archaeon]|nr:hypothetical protein [Methanomicrobiales archaeon]MDI6875473.1 hypothetical protein [Methanomicrobiales archaeon]